MRIVLQNQLFYKYKNVRLCFTFCLSCNTACHVCGVKDLRQLSHCLLFFNKNHFQGLFHERIVDYFFSDNNFDDHSSAMWLSVYKIGMNYLSTLINALNLLQ